MERIKVSEAFRYAQTNNRFEMRFGKTADMRAVYEAMEAAVESVKDEDGYYPLWLQDLGDCCEGDSFEMESSLLSGEFERYIPAVCLAVAKAFPSVPFSGAAKYDDLKCFYIQKYEFT